MNPGAFTMDGFKYIDGPVAFMIPPLPAHEAAVESVNDICMRLFESWCETRAIVPLAYLMHCWPLLDICEASIRRLAETLEELEKFHPETLGEGEVQLLRRLGSHAGGIAFHPAGDAVAPLG